MSENKKEYNVKECVDFINSISAIWYDRDFEKWYSVNSEGCVLEHDNSIELLSEGCIDADNLSVFVKHGLIIPKKLEQYLIDVVLEHERKKGEK